MREIRNFYKILVGKPERKRSHRRQKLKYGYNIKINLKIGRESVSLIQVAQDSVQWRTLVNMEMNLGDV